MTPNKYRNHISYILEKGWLLILCLCSITLNNVEDVVLFLSEEEKDWSALLVLGVITLVLIAVLVVDFFKWKNTELYIGAESITEKSGRLIRNEKTISLSKISNVNIQRNIIERLIGTAKLKIEDEAAGKATDIEIILKLEDAMKLYKRLLPGRDEIVEEDVQQETNEPMKTSLSDDYTPQYSSSEVLRHCLLTTSFLFAIPVVVAIAGIGATIAGIHEKSMGSVLISILVVLVSVGGAIWKIVQKNLSYVGFRTYRKNDCLYLNYGALTRQSFCIPIHKIHSIKIVYPFFCRMFGLCYTKIGCVGVGNENDEMDVLTLLRKEDETYRMVETLLPEFVDSFEMERGFYPKNLSRRPRRWMTGIFAWMVVIAIVGVVLFRYVRVDEIQMLWFVIPCMEVMTFFFGIQEQLMGALAYSDTYIWVSGGLLARTISIVPKGAVEQMQVYRSWMSRLLSLSTCVFTVRNKIVVNPINFVSKNDEMEQLLKEIFG